MAQISSLGSRPDPLSNLPAHAAQKAVPVPVFLSAQTDETQASPLQNQLNRLSAALHGLQANANANRAQYVSAYEKVKAGSYQVSALEVSRSLVSDMLNQQ